MKHPLPPALRRAQLFGAALVVVLCSTLALPATAQDADHRGDRHRHGQAVLHIEARIVPYAMIPPRHHRDDDGDDAVRFNMPSRQPAMTVMEQTRNFSASETTVRFGAAEAVLKTTTVVAE